MNQEEKFNEVKERIESYCNFYKIPVPKIKKHLPTDPCDFTGYDEIRLNIPASGNVQPTFYAKHVFGHYICGLEQTDISDDIANLIAKLL